MRCAHLVFARVGRDSAGRARILADGECRARWHRDLRYARTRNSFDVTAYVRGDGLTSVLYTALHPAAGLRAPGLPSEGNVRSDGVSSVVYETADGHVHEIFLQYGQWWNLDLTSVSGAPPILFAGLGPYPYVRSDAMNAVVFGGASDDESIYVLPERERMGLEQFDDCPGTEVSRTPRNATQSSCGDGRARHAAGLIRGRTCPSGSSAGSGGWRPRRFPGWRSPRRCRP